MKKTYLLVSIIFLLMLFPLSGAFALKKKPKLNLTKAKTTFSTNIPSSYSSASVRGEEKTPEIIDEYNGMYSQVYITPKSPKVFNAKPLFEWQKPDCTEASSCYITIKDSLTESVIQEIKDIKQNSYLLDYEKLGLEPGNMYLFTVKNDADPDKLDFPIEFEILSNKAKQDLNAKLNELKTSDENFSEFDFYVDEGLWFDLIECLNNELLNDPENEELKEYKKDIYKTIQ